MNRTLAALVMLAYFVLAVATLLWWAPHFFIANVDTPLQWSYRYWAASGIPFVLLLSVSAARQSLAGRFLLILLWQVLACALLLWCTIYSFDFTPQSHPFAVCHIWLTGAFVLWNLWGYRKQVQQIERYRGALA